MEMMVRQRSKREQGLSSETGDEIGNLGRINSGGA